MQKIKILLIEDNRLLCEGIATILNRQSDFEVVARSEDGNAVQQLENLQHPPDIVLLDLGLDKANSLKLMGLLQQELPAAKIIAMDILPDHVDVVEFVKAGGAGFILKNASTEEWIETIETVAKGHKVLPPMLTNSLFNQILDLKLQGGIDVPDDSIQLTPREREVIDLISNGLRNKEIAESLHISTYTVKSHVHNILEKLDLSSRLQVVAFANKKQT